MSADKQIVIQNETTALQSETAHIASSVSVGYNGYNEVDIVTVTR